MIAQNLQSPLRSTKQTETETSLSSNALLKIVNGAEKKGASVKDEYFVLQVVENKKKESKDGKGANIR